jgi:hypothetical protein
MAKTSARKTRKNTTIRKNTTRKMVIDKSPTRKMVIDKSPTRRSTRKKLPSSKIKSNIKLLKEIEKQKRNAFLARQQLRTAKNHARAEYEKLNDLMNNIGVAGNIVSDDDFLSDMLSSTIITKRNPDAQNPFILKKYR